jgi:hypothetical protein
MHGSSDLHTSLLTKPWIPLQSPSHRPYIIMGQMGPKKHAIPFVFSLLLDTYNKMWTIINSFVKFEEGLPQRIVPDFEKGAMNTLSMVFPHVHVCKRFQFFNMFVTLCDVRLYGQPASVLTELWSILGKYMQAQWVLSDPTFGRRRQLTQATLGTVGMRQAWRQPIKRKEETMAILGRCGRLGDTNSV